MWHSADEKVTKCHFRGEGMNESEYIRHGGAKIEHLKQKWTLPMWHSADEKVTKCHFRGEGMNESEYIRHGGAKIEHLKQKWTLPMWRNGRRTRFRCVRGNSWGFESLHRQI